MMATLFSTSMAVYSDQNELNEEWGRTEQNRTKKRVYQVVERKWSLSRPDHLHHTGRRPTCDRPCKPSLSWLGPNWRCPPVDRLFF